MGGVQDREVILNYPKLKGHNNEFRKGEIFLHQHKLYKALGLTVTLKINMITF